MINRIFKNKATSILGIAMLIACFVLVFLKLATLTEAGGFIGGAFFLLFSKDSMLKKNKNKTLLLFLMVLPIFTSCRTYREYSHSSETITRDTIRTTDTIRIYINIPGETVYIEGDTIYVDSLIYINLSNGKFTLPPWNTETLYAYAQAGITNNVPWLFLEQRDIKIDTNIYVNQIKILENKIKTLEKQIVIEEPWYKNPWLWICLLLLSGIAIKIGVSMKI